jgi:hypothetical protein
MKAYKRLLILGLVILGTAACEEDNKLGSGDGGQGKECKADGDCTQAGLGVCNTTATDPVCVACLPNRAGACTGTTPACGTDNTCQGCKAHSDCASEVCIYGGDGSCAEESDVIYIAMNGSGTNCTKSSPCNRMSEAVGKVTAARRYIKVTGTITNGEYAAAMSSTIFGGVDAILRGSSGGPEGIIEVQNGVNVKAYDVVLDDGDKYGVKVSSGASVELNRSKVTDAREEGILVLDGKVAISQTEVSNSGMTRRGISVVNGEISVIRSKISGNSGGGILVNDGQKFTIQNSFIVGNRLNGGILATNPAPGSKLEFTTIVDNQDGNSSGDAGGVTCNNDSFAFSNNIIFRNIGGTNGTAQTNGGCTYGNSFLIAGTGPMDLSLAFLSDTMTSPRDYHLTAASPVSVKDVAGLSCTGVDYDGDTRPIGGTCDLGADEYKP